MHPKEFKGFLEHIAELYSSLYEELHKVKRENKNMHEELIKRRQLTPTPPPVRIDGVPPTPMKILKMGFDWHIEGDPLCSISLVGRIKFNIPICNAKISPGGQIAFTCNKRIFLFKQEKFYLVEDTVKPFDPNLMKNDLTENFRCVFDFMGESLIIFHRGAVIKYTDGSRDWSVPVANVYHLVVDRGAVYVGTRMRESKILVFAEADGQAEPPECIKVYDCTDYIISFAVSDGNIVVYSDFKLSVLNRNTFLTEPTRIITMDVSDGLIYYGGEALALKTCCIAPGLEKVDSLALRKPVFVVKRWNGTVLAACQDKSLSIWDPTMRGCMRIVGSDNIVDISVNKSMIVCVDNNGSLRIWQIGAE